MVCSICEKGKGFIPFSQHYYHVFFTFEGTEQIGKAFRRQSNPGSMRHLHESALSGQDHSTHSESPLDARGGNLLSTTTSSGDHSDVLLNQVTGGHSPVARGHSTAVADSNIISTLRRSATDDYFDPFPVTGVEEYLTDTELRQCLQANATITVRTPGKLSVFFTQAASQSISTVGGSVCSINLTKSLDFNERYFVTLVNQTCTQGNKVLITSWRSKAEWTGCDDEGYPLGSYLSYTNKDVLIQLMVSDPFVNYTLHLKAVTDSFTYYGPREDHWLTIEQRFTSSYTGCLAVLPLVLF